MSQATSDKGSPIGPSEGDLLLLLGGEGRLVMECRMSREVASCRKGVAVGRECAMPVWAGDGTGVGASSLEESCPLMRLSDGVASP